MSIVKKIAFFLSGKKAIQKLLEKNISVSLKLLGVGYGSDVEDSGEKILVEKLLKSDNDEVIIFDVGANKGDFSEMIIRGLAGKKNFKLHTFEPSKHTFEKLKKRIIKSDNILLNNFALGKKEEILDLFYDKEGSGLASLSKRNLDYLNINFNYSEKVEVKTLDAYCEANNVERIDLLKLDVEGHELDVLNGGIKMFEKGLIKMASFEFGGTNIDTRTFYRDFFYFFKTYSMDIYRMTPSKKLISMNNYSELFEQFTTTNYLAIQKSK